MILLRIVHWDEDALRLRKRANPERGGEHHRGGARRCSGK
jgi:hypothetical protein